MSKRKHTYEEIKQYINNLGYELISKEYKNNSTKLIFVDNFGYLYYSSLNNIQTCKSLNIVSFYNPYTIQNIKLWCKLNNKSFELISNIYINAKEKLKWKCLIDDCGEEFEASWDNISHNKGCSYCAGQKVGLSNCLATKNPELAKEWHPTLNGDLTPYDVTCGSDKSVWWKCDKGHEWKAEIYNRNNEKGCPFCARLLPSKDYNLLVINPVLCNEWNYEKNDKKPEEYCPNSDKKVWWVCSNNKEHTWKAIIASRNKGNGCPYCAGYYASKYYNLLIINPELCKEWDYNKNIKNPEEYVPNSHQKVWWICKECSHEWMSTIHNRNNGNGCPKCNESEGEKKIDGILTQLKFPHDSQYTFNDLIGINNGLLRFDSSIFWDNEKIKLRMLIEYDGIFHYEKQYENDGFETIQIHDKLKNEYCKKNNIPLLRIPYWEFDNIENILIDWLNINNIIAKEV